jgi:DNA-binding transcriptional MerR regulator
MDLAIGELARRSGYAVQTLRYYEQIGLMPKPPRTSGGQRRYDERQLRRLLFIRHARDLGFDIDDIRSLLDLAARPDQSCASVDAIAKAHLMSIDSKIARLTSWLVS